MWAESQTVCTFPAGDNSLKDIRFKVSPMHINDKKIQQLGSVVHSVVS